MSRAAVDHFLMLWPKVMPIYPSWMQSEAHGQSLKGGIISCAIDPLSSRRMTVRTCLPDGHDDLVSS
jgi:hypothetical protein